MAKYELFGAPGCPYTREAREWLEWNGHEFIEYDVEADREALARMLEISAGQRTVPVLSEGGRLTHLGWNGRGCIVQG